MSEVREGERGQLAASQATHEQAQAVKVAPSKALVSHIIKEHSQGSKALQLAATTSRDTARRDAQVNPRRRATAIVNRARI